MKKVLLAAVPLRSTELYNIFELIVLIFCPTTVLFLFILTALYSIQRQTEANLKTGTKVVLLVGLAPGTSVVS